MKTSHRTKTQAKIKQITQWTPNYNPYARSTTILDMFMFLIRCELVELLPWCLSYAVLKKSDFLDVFGNGGFRWRSSRRHEISVVSGATKQGVGAHSLNKATGLQ